MQYRDGLSFTWDRGRVLDTVKLNGSVKATYAYNENNIRTKKTVDGVTTTYYLSGNTVMAEKKSGNLLVYLFDESGARIGFTYNGSKYYYVTNLQGDVKRVINSSGSVVAKYDYDTWGKVLAVRNGSGTDVSNDPTHIGNINPIRYRGYYYDAETGLYYVSSRYYDPEIGRFINADEPDMLFVNGKELLGANIFAYCNNNPVMNIDPSGYAMVYTRYNGAKDCLAGIIAIATAIGVGWIITKTGIDAIILGAGGTVAGVALAGAPWFVTVPMVIYGIAATVGGFFLTIGSGVQFVTAITYAIRYKTFKIDRL